MNLNHKQSGAALLLTVLTLAAFAVVIAVGTQIFLGTSRSAGKISAAGQARQMAQQGIEEGLLRYNIYAKSYVKGSPVTSSLNEYGEYGLNSLNTNTGSTTNPDTIGYSLSALRRGSTTSDCLTLTADESPDSSMANLNCPYYDLTIRSRVLLSNTIPYEYPTSVFPNTIKTEINLRAFNGASYSEVALQKKGAGLATYQLSCSNGCTTDSLISVSQVSHTVSYTGSAVLSVTYLSGAGDTSPQPLLISNRGAYINVVDKGFTTIDSIGYAGGVRIQKLVNIYDIQAKTGSSLPADWPSATNGDGSPKIVKSEREDALTYGTDGCFIFNPPAPTCSAQ